jgi:hypothetical protein
VTYGAHTLLPFVGGLNPMRDSTLID